MWSLVIAVLALVVSGVSVWTTWRLQTRARVLNLLSESRRKVAKAATETDVTIYWHVVGEPAPTFENHPNDWPNRLLRHYVESQRIYARVKRHLPGEATQRLDQLISACEKATRTSGEGEVALGKQAEFLDELEKTLDKAAHPGMKLGAGRLGDP